MRRRAFLLLVLAGVLAGCGSEDEPLSAEEVAALGVKPPALEIEAVALPPPARAEPEPGCEPGQVKRLRTKKLAFAAVAKRRTVAYAQPGKKRVAAFRRINANGYPTVFGVLSAVLDASCRPAWYRVQLPMRPNGVVGFVRARDVELKRVTSRIVVDLSERQLELFRRGKRVLEAEVAVGAPITPTPVGRYYVNQKLVASDPWGPFGPGALGISAFSPVLQEWIQGGPIAIHGTNEPSSIGRAISHGCVRVANDTLQLLFRIAPAGTPVVIRA